MTPRLSRGPPPAAAAAWLLLSPARRGCLARPARDLLHIQINGGASVVQQALEKGLLDEIQVHLAPVLPGDGVRPFDNLKQAAHADFEIERVVESPEVTHRRYRVVR
jgi:riboflavin biosynthesis pyrimidine reductase